MALTKLNFTGQPTLPSASMPTGSVIQTVHNTPSSTTYITLASSPPNMVEFSSTLRTSITPLFSNSKLRLTFTGLVGGRNSGAIISMKFYDNTNNSNVGFSSLGTGSSRTFANLSIRTVDADANDRHLQTMQAYQNASNTNARTYSIYGMVESGQTMDLNMTTTDNAGCSYVPFVFTIEEIAG